MPFMQYLAIFVILATLVTLWYLLPQSGGFWDAMTVHPYKDAKGWSFAALGLATVGNGPLKDAKRVDCCFADPGQPLRIFGHLVTTGVCIKPRGAAWRQLGPCSGAYRPLKALFWACLHSGGQNLVGL